MDGRRTDGWRPDGPLWDKLYLSDSRAKKWWENVLIFQAGQRCRRLGSEKLYYSWKRVGLVFTTLIKTLLLWVKIQTGGHWWTVAWIFTSLKGYFEHIEKGINFDISSTLFHNLLFKHLAVWYLADQQAPPPSELSTKKKKKKKKKRKITKLVPHKMRASIIMSFFLAVQTWKLCMVSFLYF